MDVNPWVKRLTLTLVPLAVLFAAALAPDTALANKGRIKRSGGQAEVLFGASACIPGQGACRSDADVSGRTAPLVGLGFNVGWRAHRSFLIGGGYSVGWFDADYEVLGSKAYSRAYQNSLFLVLRGILPIWRIDLGFELSPGWSRQVFKSEGGGPDVYSQGFALRPGLSADLWLGRQLFVGAKVDTIFNFHGSACERSGDRYSCEVKSDNSQARVNQLIGGIHIGGTF